MNAFHSEQLRRELELAGAFLFVEANASKDRRVGIAPGNRRGFDSIENESRSGLRRGTTCQEQ
jgi:hypothetical protein